MVKKQARSKKTELEVSTPAIPDEAANLDENLQNEELTKVQENGQEGAATKKSAPKKSKTTKAPKPASEPERKSSRAPKPVLKEGDAGQDYEVEKIVDVRIIQGKAEYLVRWKGYSRGDDSWEEEQDLISCQDLLKEFKLLQKSRPEKSSSTKKRSASKSPAPKAAKKKSKPIKKVEKDYEVEDVVGMREKSGKKEFKIRWKGFKASEDTWEPEKNLSCQDLIKNYMDSHQDETGTEEEPMEEGENDTEEKSSGKTPTRTKATPKGKAKSKKSKKVK